MAEGDQEVLKTVIDEIAEVVVAGRNEKIRQLEYDVRNIERNQLTFLMFSLEISKDTVIKVSQDSQNRVHITDKKNKRYEYLTKAFVILPNEYIKYDNIVEYPYRIGADYQYGAEHWLLKKPGVYTIDVDLKFKSSVPNQLKRMFEIRLEDGRYQTCLEEQGGCKKIWTFNIDNPETRLTINPLAYKQFTFTEKGYIKLYYTSGVLDN